MKKRDEKDLKDLRDVNGRHELLTMNIDAAP